MIYMRIDQTLEATIAIDDGTRVKKGDVVMNLNGRVRSIMAGKDLVCAFYGRLSGIAQEAEKYVKALEGTASKAVDTRITAPGMRMLDKYAAYAGGALTNPPSLSAAFTISKNHILAIKAKQKTLVDAVKDCRAFSTSPIKVYVEVWDTPSAKEAIEAKPDYIIFRDMTDLQEITAIQASLPSGIEGQYYGPVSLDSIEEIAETKVNEIAVPQITSEFTMQHFYMTF
jgi:nicotinate-nucleotide pyrophosphorylase (carboxylating)